MSNLSIEYFENGVKVYQDSNLYKFTSDAIKLAKFCKLKHTDNVLDMCAGCGVVGFYAYSINPCNKIYFNEIQSQMCDLIKQNIDINHMVNKAEILNQDLNTLTLNQFDKPVDVILCNPPYFKMQGKIKENQDVAICRHEIACNLRQIIEKAGQLIKQKGRFYIVIPADRLCECIVDLANNGFETKNIEMCCHKSRVGVCLIEAVKNAKSGVVIKVFEGEK